MEWFENKTTQIIALVGIVGTLAGFERIWIEIDKQDDNPLAN